MKSRDAPVAKHNFHIILFYEKQKEKQKGTLTCLLLSQNLMESLTSPLRFARLDALLAELRFGESCSVWVESEEDLSVAEGVFLLDSTSLGSGVSLWLAEGGLDFGRVDETGDVSVGDEVGWEEEVLLKGGWDGGGAINGVESSECRGGPDNEATQVSTRGQLEEIKSEDRAGLNAGDVTESFDELFSIDVRVVDDQRSTALAVSPSTHLSLSGTKLARFLYLDEIWAGSEVFEKGDGSLGFSDGVILKCLGVNHQGNFRHVRDTVATGVEERRDGRSGQRRSGGESSG